VQKWFFGYFLGNVVCTTIWQKHGILYQKQWLACFSDRGMVLDKWLRRRGVSGDRQTRKDGR
jgi:hypothetical protein